MVATKSRGMTLEEFIHLPNGGKGFELIDGELREIDVASKSQFVAGAIHAHLWNFVRPRGLGWAFPPETGFVCFADDPNRLRKPDAAFVAAADSTAEEIERSSYIKAVPVLVAEVVSPNDTVYESEAKRDQWLNAGVKVVWIVNPEGETADIYTSDGKVAFLRANGTLTAESVLPGFSLPLRDIFTLKLNGK